MYSNVIGCGLCNNLLFSRLLKEIACNISDSDASLRYLPPLPPHRKQEEEEEEKVCEGERERENRRKDGQSNTDVTDNWTKHTNCDLFIPFWFPKQISTFCVNNSHNFPLPPFTFPTIPRPLVIVKVRVYMFLTLHVCIYMCVGM